MILFEMLNPVPILGIKTIVPACDMKVLCGEKHINNNNYLLLKQSS
ncbi:MAG: hypothetical protein H6Q18_823 [Bacteroidetes bacterium]|nr:hypothetical protein [Bacteroidota bacterium]